MSPATIPNVSARGETVAYEHTRIQKYQEEEEEKEKFICRKQR